jgi:hypothetical protein
MVRDAVLGAHALHTVRYRRHAADAEHGGRKTAQPEACNRSRRTGRRYRPHDGALHHAGIGKHGLGRYAHGLLDYFRLNENAAVFHTTYVLKSFWLFRISRGAYHILGVSCESK